MSRMRSLAEELRERRARARLGGGEERIARQHAAGKPTARERIALLIEAGRFTELALRQRVPLVWLLDSAGAPKQLGGILDNDSADKAARFVNLCNAFGIPLVFLQDVPGFMVGTKVEQAGIIRHGANDVIDPRETRPTIVRALELAESKREERPWKRHGVVPV